MEALPSARPAARLEDVRGQSRARSPARGAGITRRWHESFWKWADVVAPGLFVMQAIGRWGNFFNQELYGPPTNLPWGIAIDCAHRVAAYPCTTYPEATTGFQPLFLYESISGILGAITLLWIARRWGPRMRPGDLVLIWFIWYAAVRLVLETLRTENWTLLGIPTAMIVSTVVIVVAALLLVYRHRTAAAGAERWGEPPLTVDDRDVVEVIEVDDDDELVDVDPAAAVVDVDDGQAVEVDTVEPGDVEVVEHDDAAKDTGPGDGTTDADDLEIVDDAGADHRRGGR